MFLVRNPWCRVYACVVPRNMQSYKISGSCQSTEPKQRIKFCSGAFLGSNPAIRYLTTPKTATVPASPL